MATTHGVVQIHSAPSALCPHVEWAVGGVLGVPVHLNWSAQPAERAAYRAEYRWTGPVGSAAALTSALKGWQRLRFEVTEHATAESEGLRYCYTPSLGVFQATIGLHGDIMVNEERLKAALARDALGRRGLHLGVADLLGVAWDNELEVFRQAGDGADVRWLHQVVG